VAVGRAVAGSAGKLPAKSVIHPVHPAGASSDGDLALLASCYRESLAVAAGLGARSVGFAKMAWPDSDAAARSRAAAVAISEAMTAPAPVDHVVFASPDPVMIQMYGAAYDGLSQ
jgi:O-acetyl-ADP-ribose deacetylase